MPYQSPEGTIISLPHLSIDPPSEMRGRSGPLPGNNPGWKLSPRNKFIDHRSETG